MFGVLVGLYSGPSQLGMFECEADDVFYPRSRQVYIVACSGQLGGLWNPYGWAPSLINHQRISGDSWRAQRDLHRLTHRIAQANQRRDQSQVRALKQSRRDLSRRHADVIREATLLTPLIGNSRSLSDFWPDAATGVGECCAPKLICWSAQLGIHPIGLAEFQVTYHHRSRSPRIPRAELITHVSTSEYDLSFYAPCHPRCRPLLPFLINGEVESNS